MKLYLLRHGRTVANECKVYNPLEDIMTDEGKAQVLLAAPFIQAQSFDAVYCSPLARTKETAALLGVHPHFDNRLADRLFGEFSGKPFSSLREKAATLGVPKETLVPIGGESIKQSHERFQSFLGSLPEGTHLVITHGAVIDYLVHALAGIPIEKINTDNVSLWVIEDGMVLHQNWKPWLEEKGSQKKH